MDLATDFSEAQQAIESNLVATVRAASNVAAQDISFHRSLNPAVTASLNDKSRRLLQLTERLLQRSSTNASSKIQLPTADAIEDRWRTLVDTVDSLHERTDACLDEYSGLIHKQNESDPATNAYPRPRVEREGLESSLRRPNLRKPQLDFESRPFNHETTPFRPFISQKPNASVPLNESISLSVNDDGEQQYKHPYQQEIEAYTYPSSVRAKNEPQASRPFEDTSATFVDSIEAMQEMIEELRGAKEIAIDLEHHDYRSYIGIVSLMQISTRDRDWIVDTLKPWRRKLEALNEVFTDPSILKVFHGAHMDVIWLQRDLGLYVVGVFDTHFAARVLGYPGKSLAYLLKRFVDFDAQKQYQTADWRIRPLPQQMLHYARSDTHFLLYIYDCMRNELIEKTALKAFEGQKRDCTGDVLQLSNEQCLQRYEHPFYSDSPDRSRNGWAQALTRHSGPMTQEQIAAFAELHRWRDETARDEDESTQFVMQNHVLINIARVLPSHKGALFAVSHPISPMVKQHAGTLVNLVKKAISEASSMPNLDAVAAAQSGERFTVGAALARAKAEPQQSKPPIMEQDDGQLRAKRSQLWGKTLEVSSETTNESHRQFQVLLSPLSGVDVAAAGETNGMEFGIDDANVSKPNESFADGPPGRASNLQTVTLGKRKSSAMDADDIASSASELEGFATVKPKVKSEKALRRAERKARKRAEKEASKSNGVNGSGAPEVDADDRNDQSTISSPGGAKPAQEESKTRKMAVPAFNPYARAEQAAPGLKRPRMQTAGKSATFKS